jgi:hypothetical protein
VINCILLELARGRRYRVIGGGLWSSAPRACWGRHVKVASYDLVRSLSL